MKEAERMANTQKLLAQSIESEGEEDEARGGSDLDDHKPASGKPSLEDIDGSYSPFPPVCLDDDGELILSQAEEEAQDKVVRAVSPPGAAWDSDTWWYLAAEDIGQLGEAAGTTAAAADDDGASSAKQKKEKDDDLPPRRDDGTADHDNTPGCEFVREVMCAQRADGDAKKKCTKTVSQSAGKRHGGRQKKEKKKEKAKVNYDDVSLSSPTAHSFSPVIVPTGRVRMESSPTPGSPPSSFFPASQPFPARARPLATTANESPIRPISRSEMDRVLGPSDDDEDDDDNDEQPVAKKDSEDDSEEEEEDEERAPSSGETTHNAVGRRLLRGRRRVVGAPTAEKGRPATPVSRKVSVIVEENGQMVEVIESEGAHAAGARRDETRRRAPHQQPAEPQVREGEDDNYDGDSEEEEQAKVTATRSRKNDDDDDDEDDGDEEADDADAETEKPKIEATRRNLFSDGDDDEGAADRIWLRRRQKIATAPLSKSEFRELCRGKPASSPSMLPTTRPNGTSSAGVLQTGSGGDLGGGSSGAKREAKPAIDIGHKEAKEEEGHDQECELKKRDEKDDPQSKIKAASSSAEREGVSAVVATSILPLVPSLPSFPSSSSLTEIEGHNEDAADRGPVVIVKQPAITAKTTTTTTPTITTPKTPKTTKKSTKREQTTGSKETGTGTAGERPKGGQTPAAPLALATARQSQELSEDPFAHTLRPQRAKRRRETDEQAASKPMLAGLHFILTGLNEEKPHVNASTSVATSPARLPPRVMQEAEVKELIEDLGGTVINRMAHLRQQDQQLVSSRGFVWRSAWGDLPSVILISDKHHRTLKYLMALAAGIPTIHYRWLLHSAEQGCPLPYRPYLLPAGVSLVDEKRIFHHESWPMAVFAGVSIKILGSRQFMKYWRLVLEEAGAEVEVQTGEPGNEGECKGGPPKSTAGKKSQQSRKRPRPPSLRCTVVEKETYLTRAASSSSLLLQTKEKLKEAGQEDDGRDEAATNGGVREGGDDGPVCTIEWIVQSLICRQRLDFAAHPLFCYPATSPPLACPRKEERG